MKIMTEVGINRASSRIGITAKEYRAHYEAGEVYCWMCKAWHPAREMVKVSHLSGNRCLVANRAYYKRKREERRAALGRATRDNDA